MKKICIVSVNMPPEYSGAGRRAYNHALILHQLEYEVSILTTTSETVPGEPINRNSIKKYVTGEKPFLISLFKRFIYHINIFISICSAVSRGKYDLVHCIGIANWFSLFTLVVGKLFGAVTIAEITLYGSDDLTTLKKSRHGFLKLLIVKLADAVVPISPLLAETCEKANISSEKISLIPNGVNTELFKPATIKEREITKEIFGLENYFPIFISVGIVNERKRITKLIDIFNTLKTKYNNSLLIVVGGVQSKNKDYYRLVKERIKEYSLEEIVKITGNVQNVHEWLKIADIFLFASSREGMPNALLEAMSVGLPVISFRIPLITEYIIEHGENGFMVESENDYYPIIEKLIDDREYYWYISENARAAAKDKFSEKAITAEYLKLYNSLWEKKGRDKID